MFGSRIDVRGEEFACRRQAMLDLIAKVRALEDRARIESERARPRFESRGQILPRDRLALLLDPGAPFLELANLAGYRPGADEGSIAGASQLSGIGFVSGARCLVHASDSGINAGAIMEAGVGKMLRSQQVALENKLPFINLVESAGADLLAYEISWFIRAGRMFANLARLSAAGLPVITVLHGPSTAGGAYMPGLSDVVIAVRENAKAFLGGPPLVKAATGEVATDGELGGAEMHATVTGLVEHLAENDRDAIWLARQVISRLGWGRRLRPLPRGFREPAYDPDEIAGVVPVDYRQAYDVREVIARVVDGSEMTDFKPGYGAETVCLEAEVHGHPVAIIGNNGPIDNQGATKATHFIQHCSQVGTPITYLQNTTGYMVGTAWEQGGMIKHGSKMIQAVASAPVPAFTFMIGASFGAGNYGMCGRGFGPRFLMSWPNAQTGLMGAEQAARTMRMVAEASANRKGQPIDETAQAANSQRIISHFDSQSGALVTSGLGLDDGVIDPRDTRKVLGFILGTVKEAEQLDTRPLTFGVARP